MGTLRHIFIAPTKGAPIVELAAVEALADRGLRGDRYAEDANRDSPESQVTLIESEALEAFTRDTGKPMAPGDPRRNLVTRGVRLNALAGRRFTIGQAELEGLELCEPCGTFAQRTHPEVERDLAGGGGLRCRVVRGGTMRVGDAIAAIP